jgi:DedD protein
MNPSQDTEITLSTGKMLLLFFGLVAVCAVFFGVGFSLGRSSARGGLLAADSNLTSSNSAVVRPSAVKSNNVPTPGVGDQPVIRPAVQKGSDVPAPTNVADTTAPAPPDDSNKTAVADPPITPPTNSYYVQVAAVSKQEDADALVDALKKKQYAAFAASNAPMDKLVHVQIGPFGDIKDAEATRGKLIGDGYNPIVKK